MFDWFRKKSPDFDDQWLDIETFPIPDDERSYIITDGIVVQGHYAPEYDKHGNVIFWNGRIREATHWMRYPKPPKRVSI
jgi:hypothetical protein